MDAGSKQCCSIMQMISWANWKTSAGKTEVEALLKGRGRQIRISMTYYPDINEYMGKKDTTDCCDTLPLNHRLKIRKSNAILKVVF